MIHASQDAYVFSHPPGFPCQQQARSIRNGALEAETDQRVDMLILRLVQADAAYRTAHGELQNYLILGIISSLVVLGDDENQMTTFSIVPFLYAAFSGIIAGGNLLRNSGTYHLTYNSLRNILVETESWSEVDFQVFLRRLLNIRYSSHNDIPTLINLLERYDIPTLRISSYKPHRLKEPVEDFPDPDNLDESQKKEELENP